MTSHRLAIAVAAILACDALTACQGIGPVADRGAPGTLRAAVIARYDDLARDHALPHANGAERVDFSAVVQPFLASATSSSEVAALLKANGFTIVATPEHPLAGDKEAIGYRSFVVAQLAMANGFAWRADLSCNILPAMASHDLRWAAAANCWLSTKSL